MHPKVTIIIPIYNVEQYIHTCVDSIINQTYRNLEIILVNDESPDKCPQICDDYSKDDHRVRVIHKKNGGLSDARNAGIKIAEGDYIIFLDSDDYVENTMIEDAMKVQSEYDSDVVIWGYYADSVDKEKNLLSSKVYRCISGNYKKSELTKLDISIELIGFLGYAWNKMYKKKLLIENEFKFTKGLSLVEDIVFNGPVLSKAEKITFIDKPYVHYMQRPRETLGAKFYDDYYALKSMSMISVESMLNAWGKTDQEILTVKNKMGFNALKSATRLLSVSGNYNKYEKRAYLNNLLKSNDVQDNLKEYHTQNYKDKIIKFLMLKRKVTLLLFMYKVK